MANYFRNENLKFSEAQKKGIEYKKKINSKYKNINYKLKRCFLY